MTVHCPHCLTGYLLPETLLGANGARVRCPGCQGVFMVLPEGEAVSDAGEARPGPVFPKAMSGAASERGGGMAGTAAANAPAPGEPAAGSVGFEPARDVGPGDMLGAAPAVAPAHVAVAVAVLDVLADFLGEALARSRARGTVLSDHGPAIIAVWDEYRRRAGADAPSAIFREALRDRCGVDLSQVNGDYVLSDHAHGQGAP